MIEHYPPTARATSRRLLMIGLDGATWDVIQPLGEAGRLPNLWGLACRGVRGPLRSTLPPMTFPAFPTLLTGLNPGRHGILGPESIDLSRYVDKADGAPRLAVGSAAIAGRTFLDFAGAAGLRVLSFGIPMTYPAWRLNGVMVAGFPTPDPFRLFAEPAIAVAGLDRLVPEPLATRLRGLRLDKLVDEAMSASPQETYDLAKLELESTAYFVGALLDRAEYDLVALVIRAPDIAQHGLWTYRDPRSPAHDAELVARYGHLIDSVYEAVDAAIGQLLARLGEDWLVALASDHGGGPTPTRRLHLNSWLQQRGLLTFKEGGKERLARTALRLARQVPVRAKLKSLVLRLLPAESRRQLAQARARGAAIEWDRTVAYAVTTYHPAGGVMINLRNRQPHGGVRPGDEYERYRQEIVGGLRSLADPDTGQPLMEEVHLREAVYQGPHLEAAPDIVFLANPDYMLDERPGGLVSRMDRVTASLNRFVHRIDGIVGFSGRGVFRSQAEIRGAAIADVAPTLLHALDLPLPLDLDGRVLEEAFEPEFLRDYPIRREGLVGEAGGGSEYTAEEEEGIRVALRDLGYVD